MNILYKSLFYIKSQNLVKDILSYLLPETKGNEKEVSTLSKKLQNINLIYNKIIWEREPNLQKILLLIYKSKENYLKQNYKESKKIGFEIRKEVLSSGESLTDIGKNLLLFNAELLEIKSLIDDWAQSVNEEYNIFYKDFFILTEKLLKNGEDIISTPDKNTKEYILLNQDYVLEVIKLTEMSNRKIKGLVISNRKKEEGNELLSKLKYFEEKMLMYKNNTLVFTYNILLEKIKIGFYINEEIDKNFELMSDFCYLCINNSIEDPIYSALESFRKNKKKNNSFKDYLYSFKLEIIKSEDKKFLIKLQRTGDNILKENERIKIIQVKRLEDARN